MFYLETRNENGLLNNIQIQVSIYIAGVTYTLNFVTIVQRLKNKLGTRQLPTAEILVEGAAAHLVC